MREIKFRAWDIERKKMYKVYQLDFSENDDGIFCHEQAQILVNKTEWVWLLEDEHILIQYTNLKDKNGKEIYEGDILRDNEDREIGSAIFKDGCFSFCVPESEEDEEWEMYLYTVMDKEIIGNIYENPELLE